jgi:NhaP-type Na+/H+ or K+/H+ antiporter
MATGGGLLHIIAAVVGLSVGAQLLASRFRVPSVVFLLLAGIAVGPEGIGLVQRDLTTDAVRSVVGAIVAVVVFQDAFDLKLETLGGVRVATLKLVTIGAAIAIAGTAAAVRFGLGAAWGVALLIGALVLATGPTVLVPILEVVDLPERVSATLRTEGLVNDVTAAIAAVALFEAVTLQETDAAAFLEVLVVRFGIGVAVGAVVAAVAWFLVARVDLSAGSAVRNSRLIVLASAIVAHGVAETITGEAGIAAAATAGIALGNADLPYEEEISRFEGDVTLLMLSFVFIVLTTLVEFDHLLALGTGGLVVVALVMFVVRPVSVFVSTVGDRFSREEKLFMSVVAPRGILTAGIATLFALQMRGSNPDAAATVTGTVFLVILATATLEGGAARYLADRLDLRPDPVIVVGAGELGRDLAREYEEDGSRVELVESDLDAVQRGRAEEFSVHVGDGTDREFLHSIGAAGASRIVATTGDDDVNLRIARLAVEEFGVDAVARVNDLDNRAAFEDLGVEPLARSLPDSDLSDSDLAQDWLAVFSRGGDVVEVAVGEAGLVGATVAEVERDLPPRCFVGAVTRAGRTLVPDEDLELEPGDALLLAGRAEVVRRAFEAESVRD